MPDAIHDTLQRHEAKLAQVDGLRTEVALTKQAVEQQTDETKRTNQTVETLCDRIEKRFDADDERHEKLTKWAWTGTDTKDGAETRISRAEGFASRAKWWAGATITAALGFFIWLFQAVFSRGHQ